MIKRILQLNGFSILAVILNHAAGYGFTAMIWWVHRYTNLNPPSFTEVGSLQYLILLVIKELTVFSVPAFLFVSGYFVAYSTLSSHGIVQYKFVKNRILDIFIPYLIWSCGTFVLDGVFGSIYSPIEYLIRLLTGKASPIYYFIPIIIQLYLITPVIMRFTHNHKNKLLLALSVIVHLGTIVFRYIGIFVAKVDVIPSWFFGNFILFFTIGILFGTHLNQSKQIIVRYKWFFLVGLILFTFPAIIENEWIFWTINIDFRGGVNTLSATIYSLSFLGCYLSFEQLRIPFQKFFMQLNSKLLGLYLIHPIALLLFSKFIYHIFPKLLGFSIPLVILLTIMSVLIPLGIMNSVIKLPIYNKNIYRYIFG
jgi:surface polysaccharide O-acyltransferase-like enzyme